MNRTNSVFKKPGGGRVADLKKRWDVFTSSEAEATSTSERTSEKWKTAYKLLKLLTIVVVFGALFGCVVVSRASLMFAVSQMKSYSLLSYCGVGGVDYIYQTKKSQVAWVWVVFFSFMTPEALTFLGSIRTLLMRSYELPGIIEFAVCFFFEGIHTLGLGILFFVALPNMDSLRGMMLLNALCIIPGILKLFPHQNIPKLPEIVCRILTLLSIIMQMSALMVWPIANDKQIVDSWAIPVGIFLTSFGWWEAFVAENPKFPSGRLWQVKISMTDGGTRAFTYTFISFLKIGIFLCCMIVAVPTSHPNLDISDLFREFSYSFSNQEFHKSGNLLTVMQESYEPALVLVTQIMCSWGAYYFADFACKTGIQKISYALPLTLSTPISLIILGKMCIDRQADPCVYKGDIPNHLFFSCPADTSSFDWMKLGLNGWVWVFWFLSQVWLTIHIWFPKNMKLASTEQMFATPNYNGLVIEQSLMLNRRADDGKDSRRFDFKKKHFSTKTEAQHEEEREQLQRQQQKKKKKKISLVSEQNTDFENVELDETTRIYGCATMWHETSEEMTEMLKSIFRIDDDYNNRYFAKRFLHIEDSEYYEWETHIFFDDCMELSEDTKGEFIVNQFVRLLIEMVDQCGEKWYGSRVPAQKIEPPNVFITPYGGRLVWHLPGKTQIICHLKDKNKIRHKKRWSQCMYMYYFLGYQLMNNQELTEQQKEVRAENTFLLALDGDVDFQPDAILKLVDLMKRNPTVGAACGRIHPIGSGYMQWYQMFEYAIGHWLQKATEHMMGCVLCSPGCFSLFRAKAVMDENVMHRYTTIATQPRHYVQYDQGEDRWLCTLLLQRGWRVEYSAASDSFTACPEGFKEFYNQRRRWMPSTIANIADLLSDYRNVVKQNDDISYFYILYQLMNMVGTVLGPGSIFLMLVGAFNIAFKISMFESLMWNALIIAVFVLICCFFKADHQVFAAMVLSLLYAIIMMAVLVGLLLQVGEDGLLAPTTLSLIFVAASFVLAGILHPQEFACLPMGVIYYITIPSMYLLLMIYSIFNLNNVSWGTREVPKSAAELAAEQEQNMKEEVKKVQAKPDGLLGFFQSMNEKKKGTIEFSFGNICSWLWFTTEDKNDSKSEMIMIVDKLDKIEKALNLNDTKEEKKQPVPEITNDDDKEEGELEKLNPEISQPIPKIRFPEHVIKRDEMINPYWAEDNDENRRKCKKLLQLKARPLQPIETDFWHGFIKEYLAPLNEDKKKKKEIQQGLKELRNQMVMSFLILNCIWVITIFLFQQNKEFLYFRWWFGAKGPNITFDQDQGAGFSDKVNEIILDYEYLELEPIGVVFMVFFAIVMLIQVIGMILHRIMTLGHIVASTHMWQKHNVTEYVNNHGMEIINEIKRNTDDDHGATTMEEKIEKSLQKLSEGNPDEIRRISRGNTFRRVGRSVNPDVLSELRQRHSTFKKRETLRKRGNGSVRNVTTPVTIEEEDEDSPQNSMRVGRTLSKVDPNGLIERNV